MLTPSDLRVRGFFFLRIIRYTRFMSKHPFYAEVAALAEKHTVRAYMVVGVTSDNDTQLSVIGRAASTFEDNSVSGRNVYQNMKEVSENVIRELMAEKKPEYLN